MKRLEAENVESMILVLGNQLFPEQSLRVFGTKAVVMIEDYGLCTHFQYHQQKIVLFLASMRKYRDQLIRKKYHVEYYDSDQILFRESFEKKLEDLLARFPALKTIHGFEVEDQFFEKRLQKFFKKNRIQFKPIDSPMFLNSRGMFREYLKSTKRPFMKTFYEGARKSFRILVDKEGNPEQGKWSFDSENRKKLPQEIKPPEIPRIKQDRVVEEVQAMVRKVFANHPGDVESFWIPTDRNTALKWLDRFIEERLPCFGEFQDAITSRSPFVYHSALSPVMNLGLITPEEVVQRVERAYRTLRGVPISSTEGLIRQVLGWREFVRGIYQNFSEKQWTTNHWNHHRQLADTWYTGQTGIPPLDDAIHKAQRYGYTHHIERLMVISNLMLLSEVHPHEVYRWFMEMSVDSSDWVMGPNVFGMGQFSDGGIFATKPYICGSNYLLKMGDYSKGAWCDTVDGLYWRFVEKHRPFFETNPRLSMMTGHLDRMSPDRRKSILREADRFIGAQTTG